MQVYFDISAEQWIFSLSLTIGLIVFDLFAQVTLHAQEPLQNNSGVELISCHSPFPVLSVRHLYCQLFCLFRQERPEFTHVLCSC